MAIATVNPADGRTVEVFDPLDEAGVERRLARAQSAFESWRLTTFAHRAELMQRAAELLEQANEQVARTMTLEMGKPLAQARAEAAKCAKTMRWYAERAEGLLADEHPEPGDVEDSGGVSAYVRYRPLGPVLAVMPWNFPFWQVVRFAAPALMAGNVGLLKHASNVPRTALALEELFARAGFPQGCFQTLLISSGTVEAVIRDERIAAVTLTGSEGAGRSVAAVAGDEIKKTVLELGGSDPFLVLPSADVPAAAERAVTARVQNNGQSCIAAKRFIVHTDVYEEFLSAFTARMRALTVGDPMADGTEVGPLATEQGRTDLEELVADAVALGATAECGGGRPDDPALADGWYYLPTVLTGVTPGCESTARRRSARSPPCTGSPTWTRPSPSPTTRRSA